jgi:hypothetical protein
MDGRNYIPLETGPRPSDLPHIGAITPAPPMPVPIKPSPGASLIASATRLTARKIKDRSRTRGYNRNSEAWEDDAWEMYDLVGEQRFLATTLANRMGQARLYVGKLNPADLTGDPIPLDEDDDETIPGILEAFGDTPAGRQQIIVRLGINLYMVGDGWIVGFPTGVVAQARGDEDWDQFETSVDGMSLDALDWRALSAREVKTKDDGTVTFTLPEGSVETSADDVYMIRVWRPHPADASQSDCPVRSSLPVLRELVGYTMHAGAQIDSRLAGAGILFVPVTAARAMKADLGMDPDDPNADPFTDSLLETMSVAIKDRSSPAALSPMAVTVPDESIDKFRWMSFATPLDGEMANLRSEAIRRVALGEDAPPEILLGTGGMNHWGAWLVRSDVINTHVEPPLALVCDALTSQYLHPVLRDMGMDQEEAEKYVIWYDVSEMILRPNEASDAQELYAAGVISAKALREANGFDEDDAPIEEQANAEESTEQELRQAAGARALDLAVADPQLVINPGLPALANQVYMVMSGKYADEAAPVAPSPPPPPAGETTPVPSSPSVGAIPSTSQDDAPAIAASAEPLLVGV